MSDTTQRLSIKGMAPWKGRDSRSVSSTKAFRIKDLINCYVSSDGSEIRSFPGWKCVSNHKYDEVFFASRRYDFVADPDTVDEITAFVERKKLHGLWECKGRACIIGESDFMRFDQDVTTHIQILAASNVKITVANVGRFAIGQSVFVENMDTTQGQSINNKFLEITGIAASVLTCSTGAAVVGGALQPDVGDIYVVRGNDSSINYDRHEQDVDSLTAWWIENTLDVSSVNVECFPSMVANRQLDFGDDDLTLYNEGFKTTPPNNTIQGRSRRKQKTPPYRCGGAISGDRLILPIRGYGCTFQVPFRVANSDAGGNLGVESPYNGYHDRPRGLGVPKGIMFEDETEVVADVGSGWPVGDYRVAVSYKDQYTGEIGLASEPITLTIAADQTIKIAVVHPGYELAETMALSMVIWCSLVDGVSLGYLMEISLPEYGLQPYIGAGSPTYTFLIDEYTIPSATLGGRDWTQDINFLRPAEDIAVMPMGAKCVSVIRGQVFLAGHFGDKGKRLDLRTLNGFSLFDSAKTYWDYINRLRTLPVLSNAANQFPGGPVGNGALPSSYAGVELFADYEPFGKYYGEEPAGSFLGVFQPPLKIATADILVNRSGAADGSWQHQPIRMLDRIIDPANDPQSRVGPIYMMLPQGRVQVSEKAGPYAYPSVLQLPLDNSEDQGIEMTGRIGNSLILCTRHQTFSFAWGESSAGSSPSLESSEIGSIAHNSFVEFEGGCAWIGERGIVVRRTGQEPQWVDELEQDFIGTTARYLREDSGLMGHAWSAYDRERQLVYFGMRTDRFAITYTNAVDELAPFVGVLQDVAVTADGVRSKSPCDEVIILNVRNGSISRWLPPRGRAVSWMRRIQMADGKYNMCFLAEDGRIYALDDTYADVNTKPIVLTANGDQISSAILMNEAFSNSPGYGATTYNNDNVMVGGMEAVQYRLNANTGEQEAIGLHEVLFGSSPTVTFKAPFIVKDGDTFIVGIIPMTIETHADNLGEMDNPHRIPAMTVRHSLYSEDAEGSDGRKCFVRGTGKNERQEDYADMSGSFGREMNSEVLRSHETRLDAAILDGHELRIKVDAYGGQQIRISDIELELGESRS